jgi:hypothetical protein
VAFTDSKGAADLCCYFFRQSFTLLRSACGHLGLLSTNSIIEGDSRDVALGNIQSEGGYIFRATPDFQWPGTAGVRAAQIHIAKSLSRLKCFVNDTAVSQITSFLDDYQQATPFALKRKTVYQSTGQYINGNGFIITAEQRREMVEADPRNAKVIWPYLNGELFNETPDQQPQSWAINFGTMDIAEAKLFTKPFQCVTDTVKPNRDKLTRQVHETRYWLYWDKREEFFQSVAQKDRVLVCPIVTKFLSFRFFPPTFVFSHKLKIFDVQDFSLFLLLQSSIYEAWVRQFSSTLGATLNYSTVTSLDNYPFPDGSLCNGKIGQSYYELREKILRSLNIGMTNLFNRFHSSNDSTSDIGKLRELHVAIDREVAATYEWTDLELGHGFHETKQGVRYTIGESARREVLQRLLKLNHERYAEEAKQGLHDKKGTDGKAAPKKKTVHRSVDKKSTLFDTEENQ